MALPVLNVPIYNLEIPSTKKKVKFRPFLVKEEKIILIAMQDLEDGKMQVIIDAIKQVIKNCTFDEIDVDNLTSYDLEYIFLELKKKSSGAEVDLSFACQNEVAQSQAGIHTAEGKHLCGCVNQIKLNLEDVKLVGREGRSNKIMLTNTMGVTLKEPTLASAEAAQEIVKSGDAEKIFEMIYGYIDTIFDGPTIYNEYDAAALKDFIEMLSGEQFQKIKEFFETAPTLKTDIKIKCVKCGYEETVTLEGLPSFLV